MEATKKRCLFNDTTDVKDIYSACDKIANVASTLDNEQKVEICTNLVTVINTVEYLVQRLAHAEEERFNK